jgi:hypothetical protein
MHDPFGPVTPHGGLEARPVGEIPANGADARRLASLPANEPGHGVAALHELAADLPAQEAARSSDEDLHRAETGWPVSTD